MGYGHYVVTRGGQEIEAGYLVEAECEKEDCTERIYRGVGQLCGRVPGGDEYGCGGYFCDAHLHLPDLKEEIYQCERCLLA